MLSTLCAFRSSCSFRSFGVSYAPYTPYIHVCTAPINPFVRFFEFFSRARFFISSYLICFLLFLSMVRKLLIFQHFLICSRLDDCTSRLDDCTSRLDDCTSRLDDFLSCRFPLWHRAIARLSLLCGCPHAREQCLHVFALPVGVSAALCDPALDVLRCL